MKSKLKSRFQWGGGNKTNGAFPTSKPNYSDADASTASASINITPVRVGTLNLKDNPVIDTSNHGNVTISTLSNNDRAFSKKRFDCGFDSDERATMREQMWYRNQSYLKEQEKRDGVASNVTSNAATNVASRYASDKRWSQYDHEEGSDAPDSPVGVTELDSFNHRLAQRSDSETYTHQSSSFMDATDSTSVYDDDGTRSTLFYSEGGTEEDSTFENITLGTLDTNTRYEMADADKSKKYQLGRGTPPKKLIPKDKRQSSKSRSPPPRRRDRSYSMDDASSADVISSRCPFPIADELRGTIQDVSLACSQILHAFFISPDDVDKMSDKIRDACYDLREYHAECKSSLPSRR
jgi:hypothetical protein